MVYVYRPKSWEREPHHWIGVWRVWYLFLLSIEDTKPQFRQLSPGR